MKWLVRCVVFTTWCWLVGDSVAEQHAVSEKSVQLTVDLFGGAHAYRADATAWPRLAAEFETPRALLFSVGDWQPHHRQILQEVAAKAAGHIPLVVLCNDPAQIRETTRWLTEANQDFPDLYFAMMPTDSVWLRDFGPVFLETNTNVSNTGGPNTARAGQGTKVLDFYYVGSRPKDDQLSAVWAKQTGVQHEQIRWTIQGGNLMSNGKGLALTTNRIFEDNHIEFGPTWPGKDREFDRRKVVMEEFTKACNLSQLLVLEPLQSEETQHVDMFTTFLSQRDVLVARLNPQADPINHAILERNVQRLQKVRIGGEALTVHRIEIPPRRGTAWSAYTNAVIVNDLVLIPILDDDPIHMIEQAKTAYRTLLPKHAVKTIDMSSMRNLQGELHCLSLQVPSFAPMPRVVYRFDDARDLYFPKPRNNAGS